MKRSILLAIPRSSTPRPQAPFLTALSLLTGCWTVLFPIRRASRTARPLATALLAAVPVTAVLLPAPPAQAGEGHDHGSPAPAATGPALPRFAAVSEAFELVGVLSGKQLTLYLDRAADNSPVTDAQIELEVAGAKFKAERHGDGEFEVVLGAEPPLGVLPITAAVTVGNEADLLAGELDIHAAAHEDEAAHAPPWRTYAAWGAAAAAALAALVVAGKRFGARHQRGPGDARQAHDDGDERQPHGDAHARQARGDERARLPRGDGQSRLPREDGQSRLPRDGGAA